MMMRRSTAAAYCELSVPDFEREIADGRLPNPVILGKHEHWNKVHLDKALDAISGGADNDWRRKLGLYAA
jgi:hypothetical protein